MARRVIGVDKVEDRFNATWCQTPATTTGRPASKVGDSPNICTSKVAVAAARAELDRFGSPAMRIKNRNTAVDAVASADAVRGIGFLRLFGLPTQVVGGFRWSTNTVIVAVYVAANVPNGMEIWNWTGTVCESPVVSTAWGVLVQVPLRVVIAEPLTGSSLLATWSACH